MKGQKWVAYSIIIAAAGAIIALGIFVTQNQSYEKIANEPATSAGVEQEVEQPFATPEEVRGIYLTMWSASSEDRVNEIIGLAEETGINAVIIDIKDFSGSIAYDTGVEEADAVGAEKNVIKDMGGLNQMLNDSGIYVIARQTVFQDPVLALARPDLAIRRKSGVLWRDNKGLAWVDPASKEVWDYNIDIAKDALSRGFDEINFDYIRFPSDGDLYDTAYPFWDEVTPLPIIISSFFKYLDENMADDNISADLFGLATVNNWDDMGIGQVLEDAFPHFDYIAPMVYPSHFAKGYLGFENPSDHPYEVVRFSMAGAMKRLSEFRLANEKSAKLRPWLQYFNLSGSNITYTPSVVRSQIEATKKALSDDYAGFMLWNSSNRYPLEELKIIAPPDLQK